MLRFGVVAVYFLLISGCGGGSTSDGEDSNSSPWADQGIYDDQSAQSEFLQRMYDLGAFLPPGSYDRLSDDFAEIKIDCPIFVSGLDSIKRCARILFLNPQELELEPEPPYTDAVKLLWGRAGFEIDVASGPQGLLTKAYLHTYESWVNSEYMNGELSAEDFDHREYDANGCLMDCESQIQCDIDENGQVVSQDKRSDGSLRLQFQNGAIITYLARSPYWCLVGRL